MEKASISIKGTRARWLSLCQFRVISPGVKCTQKSYSCKSSAFLYRASPGAADLCTGMLGKCSQIRYFNIFFFLHQIREHEI